MSAEAIHTGSCLCGGIKIEVRGQIEVNYNCHCTMCQKALGANYDTMCVVPSSNIVFLEKSTDTSYQSSETHFRHFCLRCGCTTFAIAPELQLCFFSTALLDNFFGTGPKEEYFVGERRPWDRLCESSVKYQSVPDMFLGGLKTSKYI